MVYSEFRSLDVWEAFVKEVREKAAEKLAKKPNLELFLDEGEARERRACMVNPIPISIVNGLCQGLDSELEEPASEQAGNFS